MSNYTKKITDVTENLALYLDPLSGQKHLQASTWHAEGWLLHTFSARECLTQPTYLTVQIDHHQHIHLAPEFLQYINHSCEPNVYFDVSKHEVRCLRDIEAGEEITFFYPSTEWSMDQAFECTCRKPSCLGIIIGAVQLDKNLIENYKLADHIMEKLSEQPLIKSGKKRGGFKGIQA
ncbi:MAG: SET domain-containing protein-lysine N-methyltransferase [Methylococcales bacterium]|nr:SET domain-containing protein-lysine N-methyltransferase [Methylococcales bacterium]